MDRKNWELIIPEPDWTLDQHFRNGDTSAIISVIFRAVRYNNFQASREMKKVAKALEGETDYKTLYNVWSFVREDITYQKDVSGHEVIKNPAVLFYYGKGDCKSFSLMVASILSHFPRIAVSFRFTAYEGDVNFVHVYIVAKINGRRLPVIIDATINRFDYEVPYKRKKDYSMTQISHMHGAPNVDRKSRPTIAQAFADGPKKAYLPAVSNIANLSQGELKLQLLKSNLVLKQNYYGDPDGTLSKAIYLIDDAISGGLVNFSLPTGSVDPVYNPVINAIVKAKARHIEQINNLQTGFNMFDPSSAISGKFFTAGLDYEGLKKCIESIKPEKADWFYRNFSGKDYVEFEGSSYKANAALLECIKTQLFIQWSKKNIFETDNFRKASHHMLYEFIDSSNSGSLSTAGQVKRGFHQSWVDAFANISGMDRDNVRLYIENGIGYTSALSKLKDIEPAGSIQALIDGVPYLNEVNRELGIKGSRIGVVDPVTAAATAKIVTGIILGAVTLIEVAIKATGQTKAQQIQSIAPSIIGSSQSARIEDMIKKQELAGYIVPAGLIVAGILLFNHSNKKKS